MIQKELINALKNMEVNLQVCLKRNSNNKSRLLCVQNVLTFIKNSKINSKHTIAKNASYFCVMHAWIRVLISLKK